MKVKQIQVKPRIVYPHNLSIIPGEVMRIHIFQPEIKAIINDCFANGTDFIVPLQIKSTNLELGICVKLIDIERFYPDGKMDIKIKGEHLVYIQKRSLNSSQHQQAFTEKLVHKVSTTHLVEISKILQSLTSIKITPNKLQENPNYIFDISNQLELPKKVKMRLLVNFRSPENQAKILLNELRIILLTTQLQESAGFRCYMN